MADPAKSRKKGTSLELAPKLQGLFFTPDGHYQPSRYKVAYGGRGSSKSWGFGSMLAALSASRKILALCARELQLSIEDSVHRLLTMQIERLGLRPYFKIEKTSIYCYTTGSQFIFAGLRNNPDKVRSLEAADIAWVEEAAKVSERSWEVLIPTIRRPGSEIWVTFNPEDASDPTSKRFIVSPSPDVARVEINWEDNPWFPDELRREKDWLYSVDPEAADHIWGGQFRTVSDAQILRGKYSVHSFESSPDWEGPYYGADWGFSADPTTFIKCWVHEGKLFIEYEAYGLGVDIDKTPDLFDEVPGGRQHVSRADNARPETISYMRRHGYPRMVGVDKWKGSVEDGVAHLRSYESIIIHPRCRHFIDEARLYSYKTDKTTGDILPDIVDKHNHCIDATRYALSPRIRKRSRSRRRRFNHMAR